MPPAPERTLRFGVMCPAGGVDAAFAASVRELVATEGLELAVVVVEDPPEPARRPPRGLWGAYLRVRPHHAIPCNRPVELPDELAGVARAGAGDVEAVSAQGLDFILRHGAGPLDPALLDAARHGIWAFHRSDEERVRDGPPGFWEISLGERATGRILQRLTARPDAGVVLQRCFVGTNPASRRRTLDELGWSATFMPARVARDVLHGTAGYLDAAPSVTGAPEPSAPTAVQVLRFLARTTRAWFAAQIAWTCRLERWHVGIVRSPIASFLEEGFEPEIEWLPQRRRGGFYADPFLHGRGPGRRLLFEDWDDRSGRGTISEVPLDAGMRGEAPRPALDAGCHMAYPFSLELDGHVLCTPETAQRDAVLLYELDPGEGRWTQRATLLEGLQAVDPTIVHHDGRWWLFCTERDESETKLLLFFAADVLGPWEPHPANPVKADIRSARPAGTPFVVDGRLYRPAQDSAGGYGRAVVINHVTRLTTTEFAEEPVARFGPPPGSPYRDGFHTLADGGDVTAVDGKARVLAPRRVLPNVVRKLYRLARRVRRAA